MFSFSYSCELVLTIIELFLFRAIATLIPVSKYRYTMVNLVVTMKILPNYTIDKGTASWPIGTSKPLAICYLLPQFHIRELRRLVGIG
jgi:hypothetical protein